MKEEREMPEGRKEDEGRKEGRFIVNSIRSLHNHPFPPLHTLPSYP
jgi:hypothetical protein